MTFGLKFNSNVCAFGGKSEREHTMQTPFCSWEKQQMHDGKLACIDDAKQGD
jgi:hypothetical protein